MERSYRRLLWSLVLIGFSLDLGSKYLVFHWLYNGGAGAEHVVVPHMFELMAQFPPGVTDPGDQLLSPLRTLLGGDALPRVNNGALFGVKLSAIFGFQIDPIWDNRLFAAVSVLAALAIAYWSSLRSTVHDRSLCAALGLILAGTLGNLYDRIVFNGVRDFIHWHYYQTEWPVFNIADCCLVCGAGLLLVQAFLAQPVPSPEATRTEGNLSTELAEAK